MADSLSKGSSIGEKINSILLDNDRVSFSELKDEDKAMVLKTIYEALPDLNGIKANLDLALLDLKRVDSADFFSPFKNQIVIAKENSGNWGRINV